MGFQGINVDAIVGDVKTGVQALFPRFAFDAESTPSLDQVKKYADDAISQITRLVKFKGYEPADIIDVDDLKFVHNWIELRVAAEIHTVLDQFKDSKTANMRLAQLEAISRQFEDSADPFPTVARATRSEPCNIYPDRVVRRSTKSETEICPDPMFFTGPLIYRR